MHSESVKKFLKKNSITPEVYTDELIEENLSHFESLKNEVNYKIEDSEEFLWYTIPLQIGWEETENWLEDSYSEAKDLVSKSKSVRDAIESISEHVATTVEFTPTQDRTYKPTDIQKARQGTCSEHSFFYVALARSVGIPSRLAVNPGEDHVWAESWDAENSKWIHVDPSEDVVDDPEFYERNWNKDISYVYSPLINGKLEDITKTYTETGVIDFGTNVSVSVISKWWSSEKAKGRFDRWYDGLSTVNFYGSQIELGDGTYDLLVNGGRLHFQISDVELKPGEKKKLKLV